MRNRIEQPSMFAAGDLCALREKSRLLIGEHAWPQAIRAVSVHVHVHAHVHVRIIYASISLATQPSGHEWLARLIRHETHFFAGASA